MCHQPALARFAAATARRQPTLTRFAALCTDGSKKPPEKPRHRVDPEKFFASLKDVEENAGVMTSPGPENAAQDNEQGGPKGKEPTRYGDWEKKGRVTDF